MLQIFCLTPHCRCSLRERRRAAASAVYMPRSGTSSRNRAGKTGWRPGSWNDRDHRLQCTPDRSAGLFPDRRLLFLRHPDRAGRRIGCRRRHLRTASLSSDERDRRQRHGADVDLRRRTAEESAPAVQTPIAGICRGSSPSGHSRRIRSAGFNGRVSVAVFMVVLSHTERSPANMRDYPGDESRS